jgi:hypothetical protein
MLFRQMPQIVTPRDAQVTLFGSRVTVGVTLWNYA